MSVKEILHQVELLNNIEQKQVAAFLVHLRHKKENDYFNKISSRINRKENAAWMSIDDFENGKSV